MVEQRTSTASPAELIRIVDGIALHQALFAAAKLGVADLLDGNTRTTVELADELQVNELALYRILRLLASQGIFEENGPRTFANSELSQLLRSGVPGSLRPLLLFTGSELFFAPFGEILYSVQTGKPARDKLFGMNVFEYLKQHPELAGVFDGAMASLAQSIAPAVASAYNFGAWGSVMDVGGGNGTLLSAILRANPGLRGVLADLPHVVERARALGLLGEELQTRSAFEPCDMFREIPSGCRAYVMKNVIHDWDDERAQAILVNCRRAVPADGALLLVELAVGAGNMPSRGKAADITMMVLTGGKERTIEEYRALLAGAGFRLNQVVPLPGDFSIIESRPVC